MGPDIRDFEIILFILSITHMKTEVWFNVFLYYWLDFVRYILFSGLPCRYLKENVLSTDVVFVYNIMSMWMVSII